MQLAISKPGLGSLSSSVLHKLYSQVRENRSTSKADQCSINLSLEVEGGDTRIETNHDEERDGKKKKKQKKKRKKNEFTMIYREDIVR